MKINSFRVRTLLFGLFYFLFPGNLSGQTHLKVIISTTLPLDSAYIGHFTDKEFIRVAFKDTLEFNFKTGNMDFYHINYLQKDKIYNAQLYLDSGSIEIFTTILNDKLIIDKVIGSPIFNKVDLWRKQHVALTQARDTIALDSFLLKSYEDNIGNMFSFHIGGRYLNLHQNDKLKLYALLPLIAKQDEDLKKKFGFSIMNDRLQGIIRNNVIALSDYELVNTRNKIIRLASPDSRFVIVDFWFVGCIPCIEDHKKIKGLLERLKEKQVELISISNDESYEKWRDYLKKNKYYWQHYKKPPGISSIISQLGIATYPTYIFISRTGEILYSTYYLDEILKEFRL